MGSPAWPMEPSFYEMKTQSREGITFTFAYPGGEKAELVIPYGKIPDDECKPCVLHDAYSAGRARHS